MVFCYIKLFEGMAVSVFKNESPVKRYLYVQGWGVLLPQELFFSLSYSGNPSFLNGHGEDLSLQAFSRTKDCESPGGNTL